MWNVILWFVIGGVIGYLAQRYIRIGRPGMVTDIVAGAGGALVVNVILSLLIPGYFNFSLMNVPSLFISVGAAALFILVAHVAAAVTHTVRA